MTIKWTVNTQVHVASLGLVVDNFGLDEIIHAGHNLAFVADWSERRKAAWKFLLYRMLYTFDNVFHTTVGLFLVAKAARKSLTSVCVGYLIELFEVNLHLGQSVSCLIKTRIFQLVRMLARILTQQTRTNNSASLV